MRSRICLYGIGVFLAFFISVGAAAEPQTSAFSIGLAPSLQVPLNLSGGEMAYTFGGSASVNVQYDFSQPSGFLLRGGLDYYYNPYQYQSQPVGSLSLFALHLDAGYQFGFSPIFRLGVFAGGGYNYGFKNTTFETGGSLYAEGGLGVDLVLSPFLGVSAGGIYRMYAGLLKDASGSFLPLNTVGFYLGFTFFLSGSEYRKELIQSTQPINPELLKGFRVASPGRGITIEKIEFAPVFPVFRKYYDDHPVGTIVIKNNESQAVTEVSVSLNIKEYMNDPKTSAIGRIEAGASREVPIFALFTEHVLDTTEATKTSAEIMVDYRMSDANYRAVRADSMRLLDRNAMTWEDDRRAAAFVTAKDPSVLTFAKNVSGMIRDVKVPGVSDKLLAAFALHEALGLYGMAYVVDPKSSYADQSKKKADTDFLQFPRQTLEYKAGDCDDLSILNAALMESIGIESAFITVPGHIFIAISLGMSPEDSRKLFTSTDDLILKDGDTWVPIEITNIQNGFVPAWKEGAKQWRENSSKGQAGFYPIREAWTVFEAVGLPGSGPEIAMPAKEKAIAAFQKEVAAFVDSEIGSEVSRLETAAKTAKDTQAIRNKLGVLYARYGRYDQAASQFKMALQQREYVPALVNLGNVSFLNKRWDEARLYYERAYKLDPLNPKVLLGLARVAFELEDYDTATTMFGYVKKLDPDLASKYGYLELKSGDSTRQADVSAIKGSVAWDDIE